MQVKKSRRVKDVEKFPHYIFNLIKVCKDKTQDLIIKFFKNKKEHKNSPKSKHEK